MKSNLFLLSLTYVREVEYQQLIVSKNLWMFQGLPNIKTKEKLAK